MANLSVTVWLGLTVPGTLTEVIVVGDGPTVVVLGGEVLPEKLGEPLNVAMTLCGPANSDEMPRPSADE